MTHDTYMYVRAYTQGESHDIEDPVQLVVVVRTTSLNILLTAMEYGFKGQ